MESIMSIRDEDKTIRDKNQKKEEREFRPTSGQGITSSSNLARSSGGPGGGNLDVNQGNQENSKQNEESRQSQGSFFSEDESYRQRGPWENYGATEEGENINSESHSRFEMDDVSGLSESQDSFIQEKQRGNQNAESQEQSHQQAKGEDWKHRQEDQQVHSKVGSPGVNIFGPSWEGEVTPSHSSNQDKEKKDTPAGSSPGASAMNPLSQEDGKDMGNLFDKSQTHRNRVNPGEDKEDDQSHKFEDDDWE
jgi:hypothetical protein